MLSEEKSIVLEESFPVPTEPFSYFDWDQKEIKQVKRPDWLDE